MSYDYTKEAGYGAGVLPNFGPVAANGRQFFVGSPSVKNVQIAAQIFKPDPSGSLRFFSTIASAIAAVTQLIVQSVTVSTAADTLTTVANHQFSNGDKVYLAGTAAPAGTTLGVQYFVVGVTQAAPTVFQIALTRGGTAIDLTTTGTAVTVYPVTSAGDVVYVLPGHVEQVSSSTALNFNVAGLSVVGLGSGYARPYIVLDTIVSATITFSAPGVSLKNFVIDGTGFDTITSMLSISASDVSISGSTFITANATNQAALGITTNALCDRFKFDGNKVVGTTDAGTTNFFQIIGGNDIEITNNYIYGAYTTSLGPINNITTACLRIRIEGNILINATASSTSVITLVAGTTGAIRNNSLAILSGTAPITGAGINVVSGNYYKAAAGVAAGTLL